jgi:hypothetical protein
MDHMGRVSRPEMLDRWRKPCLRLSKAVKRPLLPPLARPEYEEVSHSSPHSFFYFLRGLPSRQDFTPIAKKKGLVSFTMLKMRKKRKQVDQPRPRAVGTSPEKGGTLDSRMRAAAAARDRKRRRFQILELVTSHDVILVFMMLHTHPKARGETQKKLSNP